MVTETKLTRYCIVCFYISGGLKQKEQSSVATNSQANRQTVIKTGCEGSVLNVIKLINMQIKH